ncbi:MAG: hypothetical protein KUG54_01670 [Gammaproteobacteria bacterium]|nr:hypothetical protein [Gammaproteobacteria bacterium]
MNAEEFDIYQLVEELAGSPPMAAKSLCESVLEEIRGALDQVDRAGFTSVASKAAEMFLKEMQNPSMISSLLPAGVFNAHELSVDSDFFETIAESIGSDPVVSEFAELFLECGDEEVAALASALMLVGVLLVKISEERLLEQNPHPSYSESMQALDEHIKALNDLILLSKTALPAMFSFFRDFQLKEGASKGGKARKHRYADLKDVVLLLDAKAYSARNAAQAARDIGQRIEKSPEQRLLLLDDDGMELLKDPQGTMADWIRKGRKKRK